MKKIFKYLLPSFIVFVILGCIFFVNDLYPFGSMPLIQVDADYIYIPNLYKIWDLLHYGGSMFWTNLGLGNSFYAPLIIQGSLYSPLNLLLFLVKRDNIINLFGLFIIIKLCLVSLTCSIYINKKYDKVDIFYKTLFAILWTFCGFFILNYFNEIWLDIVILFPIFLIYLDKVLENKDEIGYVIILAISFIISFYFSFFIVVFILLYSAVSLYFGNRKNTKEIIFKLAKGTLIAFLISAFSSLPLIYQIFTSARFEYLISVGIFKNIAVKSLYWLLSPLFIVFLLKMIFKNGISSKQELKYFVLLGLYVIPVIFEPVNMMMHGGSYWAFPYRYGFIVIFILMDACLHYLNEKKEKNQSLIAKSDFLYFVLIAVVSSMALFFNVRYASKIIDGDSGILLGLNKVSVYFYISYIVGLIFISYVFCMLLKNKNVRYFAIGLVSLYSIYLFSSWTLYYNEHYFLSTTSQKIYENMRDIPKDGRYKIEYTVYGPYYGLILDVDCLDNWLHLVSSDELNVYKKMGYYLDDDRVYSYGGTIFTDWFLNLKYIFSFEDKEDDMYTNIGRYDNKNLYKINYNNNYGLLVDNIDNIDEENKFEYQNKIYSNLFNTDKKLINYDSYSYKSIDYIEFDYEIDGNGYFYFYGNNTENIDCVIVNGDFVYAFDDSIRYLGNYSDKVNIKIRLITYGDIDFDIGYIKKSDIVELNSDVEYKNGKYYLSSDDTKYFILPINNISGISVYNNGDKVETYKYLDNFIAVKVAKGKNVIEIKYRQPLLMIGITLSIIGLLLAFIYKKIVPNKLLLNVCYYLYIFVIAAMLLYMYVYSFFKFL